MGDPGEPASVILTQRTLRIERAGSSMALPFIFLTSVIEIADHLPGSLLIVDPGRIIAMISYQ
jgi:hypothetical protein